jgi:hypothetical protein
MNESRRPLAFLLSFDAVVVASAVVHGLLRTGNPSRYFGEGRWTMFVSCFQMFLVAVFSFGVFSVRRKHPEVARAREHWLWALIGGGFVYLTADDAFKLHERLDHFITRSLHLVPSGWTDRIDDAIIGVYGLIGLGVLFYFRREVLRFRPMLRPLAVGMVFSALCILCDTLSNRPDFFQWLTGNAGLAQQLETWFAVGDGAFQLCAQGAFVAAFYVATQYALLLAKPAPMSPAPV